MKVPSYNKENRKKHFERLPKGNYVCKILNIREGKVYGSKDGIIISFDIAEGEYKDFYKKQYAANTSEDKKWPWVAEYQLVIPTEGGDSRDTTNWDTFWANVEDSNNGYVFDGDEKKVVGKTFGAAFRIRQTQKNGYINDNTVIAWSTIAQDVRDGKVKEASDQLIDTGNGDGNTDIASADGFMATSPAPAEDLPWK